MSWTAYWDSDGIPPRRQAPIGYGWVEVPIDSGPLMDALNNNGTHAGGVTQKVRGWFCWGCRGVAPEAVGREVFEAEHAQCGGGER